MKKINEIFKKIWDWIVGAGKYVAGAIVSLIVTLTAGKILLSKKSKEDVIKEDIKDLKKEIKEEIKSAESQINTIEDMEDHIESNLQEINVEIQQDKQQTRKVDLKEILPDL